MGADWRYQVPAPLPQYRDAATGGWLRYDPTGEMDRLYGPPPLYGELKDFAAMPRPGHTHAITDDVLDFIWQKYVPAELLQQLLPRAVLKEYLPEKIYDALYPSTSGGTAALPSSSSSSSLANWQRYLPPVVIQQYVPDNLLKQYIPRGTGVNKPVPQGAGVVQAPLVSNPNPGGAFNPVLPSGGVLPGGDKLGQTPAPGLGVFGGGQPMPTAVPGFGGGQPMPTVVPGFGGGQPMPTAVPGFGGGQPMPTAVPGFGGGQPMPTAVPGFGGGQPMPTAVPGFGGGQPMPTAIPGSSAGGFNPSSRFPGSSNGVTPAPTTPSTPATATTPVQPVTTAGQTPGLSGQLPRELQEALDRTNLYRVRHGANPLVWDSGVAASAAAFASGCPRGHSMNSTVGENLAWGHSSFKDAVDAWYNEVSWQENVYLTTRLLTSTCNAQNETIRLHFTLCYCIHLCL